MTAIEPTPCFGEWLPTADALAHYRLAGAFLCGSAAVAVKTALRADQKGKRSGTGAGDGAILVPHCPACMAANTRRWCERKAGAKA